MKLYKFAILIFLISEGNDDRHGFVTDALNPNNFISTRQNLIFDFQLSY